MDMLYEKTKIPIIWSKYWSSEDQEKSY